MSKIPALNGIRALSVLLVVISHTGFGYVVPGGFGVTVFFFLSGYLITTLFINEIKQTGSINIQHFFIRRLVRLYPPFFVSIIVAYTLSYLGVIGGHATWLGALSQIFYFANYLSIFFNAAELIPAGTGIYWSLSVEEHFYLIYPFVVFLFIPQRFKKEYLVFFLLSIVVLIFFWRYFLYNENAIFTSRILFATDTRVDSIIFGCLLALIKNPAECVARDMTKKDFFILITSLCMLLFTFICRGDEFRHTLRFSLQGVSISVLFYYAIAFHHHGLFSCLGSALLERIGLYSYSIYLMHYLFIEIIKSNFAIISNDFFLLISVLACSLLASYLIHTFVEKPTHQYRVKYR